jgi:hypothetical protein
MPVHCSLGVALGSQDHVLLGFFRNDLAGLKLNLDFEFGSRLWRSMS